MQTWFKMPLLKGLFVTVTVVRFNILERKPKKPNYNGIT